MNKSWRSAWCKKAELSDRADSDTTKGLPHGDYVQFLRPTRATRDPERFAD
jgi:hypothetical protein